MTSSNGNSAPADDSGRGDAASTPEPEEIWELVASCAFGLESIVGRELTALGFTPRITDPGQVEFSGGWTAICQANIWLRCADRILIQLAQRPCTDFDTLFDAVKSVPWERWLSHDAAIHVTGGSVKSALTSLPAIQRTAKKAIVEHMIGGGYAPALPETGPRHRVHIALRNNQLRVTLDTTGASLHKRGYREIATKAPLKETLAAALVALSFWKPERPLIDPFCGGGTILIEAAMIGRRIAPGLRREFACEAWPLAPTDCWTATRFAAEEQILPQLPIRLLGFDIHHGAISLARRNAQQAGVENDTHFQQAEFSELSSKREHGCIITNPPYGDRLDAKVLQELYQAMPIVLSRLPSWSHFILTAYPDFERLVGKQAHRRRKLYNGRIECTYFQFHGPSPANKPHSDRRNSPASSPVFGGITSKGKEQAELFASRLRKRARHLRRWPTKRGVTCYRIYERDIPEIPLVVDRYEDHLHIVEFERPHDRDLAQHSQWLELMAATAGEVLETPPEKIFLKTRQPQKGRSQHERLSTQGYEIIVQEGELRFIVNLSDYADTGLFLDHRNARQMTREMSSGKRVLNLFAYTGAFSVYAAAGQARSVVSVDTSAQYLQWAERNMKLNADGGVDPSWQFVRADAIEYVESLPDVPQFDLIICDPPTFSNSKRTEETWQVERDHGELIRMLLLRLTSDGVIFFSSNFRRFHMDETLQQHATLREISKQTLPEDYRNQRVHRSWLIWHRKDPHELACPE